MASTFVVDGYNLMHAIGYLTGKVKPPALAYARLRLQEYLCAAFGAAANQVVLVYDAPNAPPKIVRGDTYKGMTILLAVGKQEADDLIESYLDQHSAPNQLAVVSNDQRLQTAARHAGAKAMTCTEFLDYLDRSHAEKSLQKPDCTEKKEQLSKEEIQEWMLEFTGLEKEPDLKEALKPFDFEEE
jgi:uncharacterized protein